MNSKRDWARLEAEYVTGDISLRAMARREKLALSSISRQHQSRGSWIEKRKAYRASLSARALDLMADQGAVDVAARNMQILAIGDKVASLFEQQIPVWQAQIAEGKTPISVRDYRLVADLTRLIIGEPTERKEERSLGLNLHAFNPDQLERLERAVRPRLPDSGATNGVAPDDAETAGAD